MKAATAKLLRAVIRLVEDDVRELADTVVEIDEREAAHFGFIMARVELLEDNQRHSRRVEP